MTDDTIKTRLLEFLKSRRISQTEFTRAMGVSTTYVGAMRKGMPADKLKKLFELYPELNRDWLIYGEGKMLVEPAADDKIISREHETLLLPVEAFAGGLEMWSEGVKAADCRRIISPVSNPDFAITIKGESMEPRFHDGSTLFIKKINDKAFIPWGHTLVVDTENGVFIKNLLPDNSPEKNPDEQHIIARSINPDYPEFKIPTSSIYGIYRILGAVDIYTTL